jgi:hypothetical protein
MTTIKMQITEKQAAEEVVKIMEKFYTGNMMDITIGFTEDGQVDYDFDVHGPGDIVWSVYRTEGGWTCDNDGNPDDQEWWNENRDDLAECFSDGCWGMHDESAVEYGWEIEWPKEK